MVTSELFTEDSFVKKTKLIKQVDSLWIFERPEAIIMRNLEASLFSLSALMFKTWREDLEICSVISSRPFQAQTINTELSLRHELKLCLQELSGF